MPFFKKLIRFNRYGLRIDFLWIAAVLAGCLFLGSLVPQPPNDFWWHLKIGQVIYETGRIPKTNMFAWTLPYDAPFVYGAWLSELLLYLTYLLGRLELIFFLRNLMLAVALSLTVVEAHRRCRSWKLAATMTGLAFLMMINNLIVRPQNWSWLGFTLFLWLLNRYADDKLSGWALALSCAGVMALWVNLHGAFVLGPVLVVIYLIGEIGQRWFRMPDAWSWSRIRPLLGTLAVMLVAIMLNPQGVRIFKYVYNLMTDAPSQQLIVEWQSPSPEGPSNLVFFGSILLFLICAWYSKTQPRLRDILLVIGFLWLAWTGVRYVVWFALVAIPILTQVVSKLIASASFLYTSHRNLLNIGIAILILMPVILAQPWFLDSLYPILPDDYLDMILLDAEEGVLLGVKNPIEVASFLKMDPKTRLFTEMGYASYFIWALPDQKVFADPRVELYPYELWQDYRRISNGVRVEELLDAYDIERIVLDTDLQPELDLALNELKHWERVYENERTEVWDRMSGVLE
jgi:hypothetical protein